MSNRNIQMKKRNGETWDNLFPITKIDNVFNDQGKSLGTLLSEKASITYVDALLIDIAKGGPKGLFMSIASLTSTYPTGADGTWLVFDSSHTDGAHAYIWDSVNNVWKDLGLYQAYGYQDRSISAEKLGTDVLTELTVNLLKPEEFVSDGYYTVNGSLVTDSQYKSSQLIPAREGDQFWFDTGSGQYTIHDRNGEFLQGFDVPTPGPVTIPSHVFARYIRKVVDTYRSNNKVVSGIQERAYKLSDKVKPKDVTTPIIPSEIKHVETVHQMNLIDFEQLEVMHYYDAYTGERKYSWMVTSTHIIPVNPGDPIFRDNLESGQVSFWDASGNFVVGLDNGNAIDYVPNNPAITGMRANLTIGDNIRSKTAWISISDKPIRTRYKFPAKYFDMDIPANTGGGQVVVDDFIKPYHKVVNPVLTPGMVTDRTGVTGVADPFIVVEDGTFHMFFEVLSSTGDEIGHAYSHDMRTWSYTGIVMSIAEHGHRSAYPNVFKVDGVWYMLPDTGWQVNLYRATNFPSQWERIVDFMLPNVGGYNDTNVFKVAGSWYLTTSFGGEGIRLYKNTTSDFKNDNWTYVSLIIPSDSYETNMRGAGNPKVYDDSYVLMPVQVSPADGVYGQYTYLYKLGGFENNSVLAANMGILTNRTNDGTWTDGAMHHAAHTEFMGTQIFAVDGWKAPNVYTIGIYIKS